MKEEFQPVDLGNLENKALMIVYCFHKAYDPDRSEKYRSYHLKKAEKVAETLLNDFGYYMDNYKIGGVEPYELSELKKETK